MNTSTRPLLNTILTESFWSKIIVFGIGCLLSGLILKTVVAKVGVSRTATAVIHVSEANVDVAIDGAIYRIDEQVYDPIVRELAPGKHAISMTRGSYLLYQEEFDIEGGQEVVLTAHVQEP